MLIVNADLHGKRADVRFGAKIAEIQPKIHPRPGEQVVDARGGCVLPGLHDHHMHFLASAAWANSINCGDAHVTNAKTLGQLLRSQPGSGWLRGVNYHESTAGELFCSGLDQLIDDRPVRIQHRSGKVWMLNSVAVEQLELHEYAGLDGVEVDTHGKVTGRLFRLDGWLRQRLASDISTDVRELSQQLSRFGITGFTDTSATNSLQTQKQFAQWQRDGMLQQNVLLMGDDSLPAGPLKVILDEDALPTLSDLVARLHRARASGRSLAFHCVTHVELLFALSALAEVEPDSKDRIEHGAIVHDQVLPLLKERSVSVVTQPGFLWQRGDQYLRDLPASDVAVLYRHRALLEAGINAVVSSDAPYGPLNPWLVMAAADRRVTRTGHIIGEAETVPPQQSLCGYLLHKHDLHEPMRQVSIDADADLCVLTKPWSEVKNNIAQTQVRATICAGQMVYFEKNSQRRQTLL